MVFSFPQYWDIGNATDSLFWIIPEIRSKIKNIGIFRR